MVRGEVIKALAKKEHLTEIQARKILDTTFEIIEEGIVRDGEVTVIRFGTFTRKIHKGRYYTDLSGKRVWADETIRVKFHPCGGMRGKIRKHAEEEEGKED